VSYGRVCLAVFALLLGTAVARTVRADEWKPISQEELKMTEYAKAPGAPAIILYRQVDRDDSNPHVPHEYNYVREKIFTEEGRKYADVDIPIVKGQWNIVNIRARTIHPDGSTVDFDGKVYEKEIVKARGFKYLAKTFTLSDVQPGSIIEYHYMIDFAEGYVFNSNWIVSDDLFTKSAKFTLKPYTEWALQWTWPNGLPQNAEPPVNEANVVHMETNDIPAFLVEDDMPPEGAMRFRVDFIYSEEGFESDKDKFWKKQGKKMGDKAEGFLNKRKAMEQAVGEIVSSGDSADAKLQKIYARVQKIRNRGYEEEKTAQEEKRAKEKDPGNVEDVWKWGYGDGNDITLLFVGLARAAGFDASAARVSTRDDHFFNQGVMRARDLNTYIAVVSLNGKDTYFDPGSLYVPYGLLPWSETDARGLKLTRDGGTWITTALPTSSDSQVVRKADLNLTNEGSLEGKLTVTFTGLEAQFRRVQERNEDEAARKKMLEDYVKENIPVGTEVDLTNKPDWTTSATSLVAEYSLKVPGWVSGAGKRALCPVALFSAAEKHMYEHSTRVHPVYFHFPYEKIDDVHIELPLGWQVGSLPQIPDADGKVVTYTLKAESDKGGVHLQRHLKSQLEMLEVKYYPALRNFYQAVRTGDEQQVVLQPGIAGASN
jgi:hypothetical protein